MLGVVAAGNEQTAAAAASILQKGGNAVDAAVAAAFTSFIAEVGVVHLGGSGLAQIYDPVSGQGHVYDFFSNMPGLDRGSDHTSLNFERVTIDYGATTQDFHLGRGSVAVPGNIFGLCRLAAEHGHLPLGQLLEPAQRLAQTGAVLDTFQADTCKLLRPLYTHTPGMAAIFAPDGVMLDSGDTVRIPHLAATLTQLALEGEGLLRSGRLAKTFVQDQQQRGGLLTREDLESYKVGIHQPIRQKYRQFEVLLPPPCSTGGLLTAFALKLLEPFSFEGMVHGSAPHLRLLYEVLAATARARPYWDASVANGTWSDAMMTMLTDQFAGPYVEEVRQALQGSASSARVTEPPAPQSTSHLSVIDGNGMAVTLTTTAGESAGYVVPGTGFIPNNILGEEDLNPGGFHRWPVGQRIFTMMTPLVVLAGGRIRLVTGSGGANRIRSAILQVLVNVLDFNLPLESAVNAPRIHVEDGIMQCEAGYDARAVDELEQAGYEVNRWHTRSIYFGGAHSVAQEDDGALRAAGDNRRGGATAVAR